MRTITKSLLSAILLVAPILASAQKSKTGILVLAHGGSETWNAMIQDAVNPIKDKYAVEISFGMADPKTLEAGIRKLESQKVERIVVVPLFISSHSFIIRQTEYFLGKRSELADPLILMDHVGGSLGHAGGSSGHAMHDMDSENGKKPMIPKQISSNTEIKITSALDDHNVVARILSKRIQELSKNPINETVIIVGHGPNPEADNRNWVSNMESLANKIGELNKKEGREFKNLFALTVRDDASPEIYEMAKENLRSTVRQSSQNSKVIIVPLLLSQGGIEKGIVKRLEGLDYIWNGKTLLPDPLITDFIMESVNHALEKW